MTDPMLAVSDLSAQEIRTVIVATPDVQGRLVGRRLPAERFAEVIDRGVDISLCAWSWDIAQSTSLIDADRLPLCGMHNGVPDATLLPDLSTLRRAAWLDDTAICLADTVDAKTREPLPVSPRSILRAELSRGEEAGRAASVGTELELYLFRNEPRALRLSGFRDLEPSTLVPADFMIHEGDVHESFFSRVRTALAESGIPIEAAQSEHGIGQWELTFPHTDPLTMADRHSLYKLAVRDMAAQAGLSVTFMAQPVADQPGSSCHVHLSLRDDGGAPVMFDPEAPGGMSAVMRQAAAGALAFAGDFLAWYAPTVNSFRRLSGHGVAGTSGTWGIDDRGATVRVVGDAPASKRFEFRLPGADANPYLVLAGLLASVRHGIERRLDLRDRGAASIDLPPHLGEAARRFGVSPIVADVLTPLAVDHLTALVEHEWETFLSTVSDWDLNRYFDRI